MSRAKPSVADPYIGAMIRRFRQEEGLSMRELGERVGVAVQQIQKYEVGRDRVSAGRLFDIARVLGQPVGNFFPLLRPNGELNLTVSDRVNEPRGRAAR